jgi:predicted RNA-binding Zn ribbon-like protein
VEGNPGPATVRSSDAGTEFPLLGEPFAVEFANTLYQEDDTVFDFLGASDLVADWFAVIGGNFVLPARLGAGTVSLLREVRVAARQLFDDVIDGAEHASQHAIATLNRSAGLAALHLRLDWPTGGAPRVNLHHRGDAAAVLVACVASECLSFIAGPDRVRLRRCDRPGCYMIFVQQHHRRRYCNDLCASSDRQSRYYRRTIESRSAKGHVPTIHGSNKRRGNAQ